MKNIKIKEVEILGILFGILVGGLLHFTYELSGDSQLVAIFSSVNESVWEHTKLFFFPVLVYLAVEWFFVKDKKTLLLAKVMESLFGITFIIVFYYFYTVFITGNFIIDITYFVITVALGKLISYKIITSKREWQGYTWLHITVLVLLVMLYSATTFITPELELFKDSNTNTYGI